MRSFTEARLVAGRWLAGLLRFDDIARDCEEALAAVKLEAVRPRILSIVRNPQGSVLYLVNVSSNDRRYPKVTFVSRKGSWDRYPVDWRVCRPHPLGNLASDSAWDVYIALEAIPWAKPFVKDWIEPACADAQVNFER